MSCWLGGTGDDYGAINAKPFNVTRNLARHFRISIAIDNTMQWQVTSKIANDSHKVSNL